MATTNRVYCWKDGDRLFVDVNGATVEAKALTFAEYVVTLQFHGNVVRMRTADSSSNTSPSATRVRSADRCDPLLDECLW